MSVDHTTPHLGFIGLGKMGGPIAERLIRHGSPITVYDIDARALDAAVKAGGRPAGSPRAVASEAQIVFTCLPALEIVREVALGAEGVCHGNAVEILVECSTTGPEFATNLGVELAKHDITLLDSPVSGGVK
ncbi:MAG: NAD(P)-binding domain-containing protein, partial [Betaproteobacteria bacterium]|nr:NAD(P)-binding domain-containing protein [Betaproteobacteria bacterium]